MTTNVLPLYKCSIRVNRLTTFSLFIEEIRIGSHCKGFPYIDTRYMCCSSSSWSASSIGSSYEFAVYANPANNVSVTIEQIKWLVDKDARNGVDIGLYTLQNKTNPTIWVR